MFLQRRLEVLPRQAALPHFLQQRTELAQDERARLLDTPVQIDGRNQRLVAVGEQRQLAAATALLLAASQQQVIAERQPFSLATQRGGRDERRLDLRLLSLVEGWKLAEQHVCDD